ncbi:putative ankyrin repeat domain-containing protein 27 [Paratrimastix pyriformis]|uniref:Ankyrin repeat domain-containing protein 27 n=1 Tax=Paratrimastix pyriformis TaxID=342808 RepID=A0ABQ8UD99_9EUKA|nr:putative ankyrin repeat domain-containing protein 27 [Paratrimastix pyriformis]
MADGETLLNSVYYKSLKAKFPELLSKATDNQGIICIPDSDSLAGIVLDQDFFETHILRPSPYILGEFLTANGHAIEYDERERLFRTKDFPELRTVRVLHEESCYNKRLKPYRMFLLQRPFRRQASGTAGEGNTASSRGTGSSSGSFAITTMAPCFTPAEASEALERLSTGPNRATIVECGDTLTTRARKFAQSYMFVRGCEQHAQSVIQGMVDTGFQTLSVLCPELATCASNSKHHFVLTSILHNLVHGAMGQLLFDSVSKTMAAEDAAMGALLDQLAPLRPQAFGIPDHLVCQLPLTVELLKSLEGCLTPLHKLHVLQQVFLTLGREIELHLTRLNAASSPAPSTPPSPMPSLPPTGPATGVMAATGAGQIASRPATPPSSRGQLADTQSDPMLSLCRSPASARHDPILSAFLKGGPMPSQTLQQQPPPSPLATAPEQCPPGGGPTNSTINSSLLTPLVRTAEQKRALQAAALAQALPLTTDDLLPLYMWALAQAQPPQLHSNALWVRAFAPMPPEQGELAFSLATFEASIEHLARDGPRLVRAALTTPPQMSLNPRPSASGGPGAGSPSGLVVLGPLQPGPPLDPASARVGFRPGSEGRTMRLTATTECFDFAPVIAPRAAVPPAFAPRTSEPLILILLLIPVVNFTIFMLTRNRSTFQMIWSSVCAALTLLIWPLNKLGRRYWRNFASQNYFDEQGAFVAIFFGLPMLVILLCIMVNWVWKMGSLFIKVSKLHVKKVAAKKALEATGGTAAGPSDLSTSSPSAGQKNKDL